MWVEPGAVAGARSWPPVESTPSASPPSGAGIPGRQTIEGTVESMAVSELTLEMPDGRRVEVDTSRLPPGAVDAVRPSDRVTVTGTPDADLGRLLAASLT